MACQKIEYCIEITFSDFYRHTVQDEQWMSGTGILRLFLTSLFTTIVFVVHHRMYMEKCSLIDAAIELKSTKHI